MFQKILLKLQKNWPVLSSAFIFLIFVNIPAILQFFVAKNNNLNFTAIPLMNGLDHFYYLSSVEQGKFGHIFLQNLYNYAEQGRLLFSPHWYLIGQLGNWLNIDVVGSYQLARFLLQIIFISILYWWIKKIFINKKQHWWILLILLLTNGLGSILYPWYKNINLRPTNTLMPESITFLSLQQGPLLILSQILLLLIMAWFIKYWETKKIKFLISTIVSFILLAAIHPYDLSIILAVLGLWSLFIWKAYRDKKILFYYSILILITIFSAIYYLWLFQDKVMLQWKLQNTLVSASLPNYLLGLGIVAPLAVGGIVYLLKNRTKNIYLILMFIWASAGWFMIYAPLDFNRRLSNGWHIALCFMTVIFIQYLYKLLPFLIRLLTLFIFVFLLTVDTAQYIKISLIRITKINEPEYFYNLEQKNIYKQIENLQPSPKIFMTRAMDGNSLPAFTGQKVYVGHNINTWEADKKNIEVQKMWTSHQDISSWLKDKHIDYIYASARYIPEFSNIKWLAKEPYITPLIDDQNYILYQFTPKQ